MTQAAGNAARTGFSADALGLSTPGATWFKQYTPTERVNPQQQPIVGGGRVYLATEGMHDNPSKLYAYGATTGTASWAAVTLAGPVWASVAYDGTRVHACGLDGTVTRVTAATGAIEGTYQRTSRFGYMASPTLADGQLFVCDLGGVVTSLNPATYAVNWQRALTTGAGLRAPIVATPAHDGTKLYVPRMDCAVTAITTTGNSVAWTAQLEGLTIKDYWPVVTPQGLLVAVQPRYPLLNGGDPGAGIAPTNRGIVPAGDWTATSPTDTQAVKLADAAANPGNYVKSLYLLNFSTGAEVRPLIHWQQAITMFGTMPAPALDDQGYAIVPVVKPNSWEGRWGRLDLATGRMAAWLGDYLGGAVDNNDENVQPSCFATDTVVAHVQDYPQAQFQGARRRTTGTWRAYPRGAWTPRYMGNMQAGKGAPMSGANGWLYHNTQNVLVARNTA